jgi:CDP-paratose 2-epimerase
MKKKRICVIGGAGFIGSHLARKYFSEKNDVIIIDDLSRKLTKYNLKFIDKKIKFIKLDISKKKNFDILKKVFKNVDIIFHCAAQVAVTTSLVDPVRDFEINMIGSMNVLEAVRNSNPKAIIFFSSTNKVYGDLESIQLKEYVKNYEFKKIRCINENYPLDFHTPYGCSKGAADQYFLDYARYYGIRTVVFRKSCIYGTHQYGVEDQGWLSWFAIAGIIGKKITVYGNGKQVRDVLYIDDLINAYQLAENKIHLTAGQVFNIGGGNDNKISVIQAIEKISRYTNKEIKICYQNSREGDQKIYISDNSKATEVFGWQPQITIEKGFRNMIEWIQHNKKIFS